MSNSNLHDFLDCCSESKFFLLKCGDDVSGPYFVSSTSIAFNIGKTYLISVGAMIGTVILIDKYEADKLLVTWNYKEFLDSRKFKTFIIGA
jgi:hypothetical protein